MATTLAYSTCQQHLQGHACCSNACSTSFVAAMLRGKSRAVWSEGKGGGVD